MTCETPIFLYMVSSIIRREVYPVHVHCIWIWDWRFLPEGGPFLWGASGNDVVIPSSDFLESYNIPVKFSCLIEPLFSFPPCFFLAERKDTGGHHYGQLVRDSSLKGIY